VKKLTRYERYQDYVIRNGRLIGEFDEMYRDFEDPWEQSARENDALDKTIGLELLKKYGHHRPLEYGCGLGHYTARLHDELGAAAGLDISETAIAKAKQRRPQPVFFVGDILNPLPLQTFKPDSLVFAEITWYVLESLEAFKELMARSSCGEDFLHILTTYPPGRQGYGVDYFTNHDEIMNYWPDVVDIKEWALVSKEDTQGVRRSLFYGRIR
jgi:SAM-dependent methyltransferase